jgi:hypothetical protein
VAAFNSCFEYDIYVPTADNDGVRYETRELDVIRKELTDYFGGLTDTKYRNEGLWKVGSVTVRDEVAIWRILSDKGAEGDRIIAQIKARLERCLAQDLVMVVRRSVDSFR